MGVAGGEGKRAVQEAAVGGRRRDSRYEND